MPNYNITTHKITDTAQDEQGRIISAHDNPIAFGSYPLAAEQPEQLPFQTQLTEMAIVNNEAVKQYADITINEAKEQLITQIKEKREQLERDPFIWLHQDGTNCEQNTSESSYIKLMRCINNNWSGEWFFNNGSKILTTEELRSIEQQWALVVSQLFATQSAKFNEVQALTTIEQCRLYDVNTGW